MSLTVSIREMVRQRIIDDMLGTLTRGQDKQDPWKVLIVDEETVHILNASVRVRDINKKNVTVIEHIEKSRQPFPNMVGVYFLAPTQKSVNKFLEDFSDKKQLYGCACLFFTSRLSKKLMDLISSSKGVKFIKTLIELNLDFLAVDRTTFSLNTPEDMELIYSPKTNEDTKTKVADILADKMLSLCITMGQQPFIRYDRKGQLTQLVSEKLSDKLETYRTRSAKHNLPVLRQDSILLILDRSVDVIAPILHEFTYQAMAYDLLNIPIGGIYEQKYQDQKNQEQKRRVILDEYDEVWTKYKPVHIDMAKRQLDKEINEFVNKNKDTFGNTKDKKDVKDLSSMMAKLPQYREQYTKYGVHRTNISELISRFAKDQLPKIALLEQNMACGQTPEGEKLGNITNSVSALLRDETISLENKLRLLMVYLLTQTGVTEDNRAKLIKYGKLEGKPERVINNLPCLGVQLTKTTSIFGKIQKLLRLDAKPAKDVDYELSRYVTKLKELAEETIKGTLSTKDYPFVKEPSKDFRFEVKEAKKDPKSKDKVAAKKEEETVSLRTKKTGPAWERKGASKPEENLVASSSSGAANKTGNKKLIVLMIGGVTHSETRCAVEFEQDLQVETYVGGTSLITPKLFLDKLASLK